jgi:hypothetical protein
MQPRHVPPQAIVALVALVLWSLDPGGALTWLLVSYAIAWLALNVVAAARPSWLALSLSRAQTIALVVLLALPSTVQAVRFYDDVIEREELVAIDQHLRWRMRLERTPSIAPPLISGDRPQTFYVHAPGVSSVSVRFSERRARGSSLGQGLFRVEYDPRRDGVITDGDVRVAILTDGEEHERTMQGAVPLAHPRWLRPSDDRTRAVTTSEETDEVVVIDARGSTRRVATDDGPSDAAWIGDTIAVVHRYADTLLFIDADGAERRHRIGPFAHHIAHRSGRIAIAQHGEEPRILVTRADGAPVASITTPYRPDWVAFAADDTLIVSSVAPPALHRLRISEGAIEPDGTRALGRPAVALAVGDGLAYAAVTDYRPQGPPHAGNHFVQDQLLTFDVERWRLVDRRFTAIRTPRQRGPGEVDRGASPTAIDPLSDGTLIVAFAGTDEVWRIRPDGEPEIIDTGDDVAAPLSAVALGDTIVISSPSQGVIALARGGDITHVERLAPDDRTLMDDNELALQRRIGERMFYEATRAGMSCQSCHLHGGSDGGHHNIGGYELLATLDVRGTLGTPPYLRDGSYPTIASFDTNLSSELLRGYRRRQPGRVVSLERWIGDLPRPNVARVDRDLARERRGYAAFIDARCPMCHAPPAFTNLGQHPVTTIFPSLAEHDGFELDTPSLLGLSESAPYLFDGRATTLESIFSEHDRARRHGDTASLNERELDDLLYFIAAL